ncbi:Ulp1 family isopeptidase [Mesorhizobium sp. M5C.F.Cr.IN.023.01.1.1]|uniref:Ulp1 family isopeptidase n=1 Tax=Mesorhizobium sp. M5C.F.Cr.IN.023.01.1.1 TaxID=2496768 RepID=UPI001FDEC72A|nr:Ulp1 family isopeptidase [Mesorhizobium sp. M5C.F.Cr.IN.023.01.1.1]
MGELQAADELMGAPGEEVLVNGSHGKGELRPTKRQRIQSNLQHAVTERQPGEVGNSGARVMMQLPTHQVGTSEREAQLVMQGDEHEYTPAPHLDGSMPSTVQPDRPIVVPDGADKRPVYSNDATAIEGLKSALLAGKARPDTVTRSTNSLFGFSRWLFQNNKPGLAARLYHPSLSQDLEEYESRGGSSTVAGALRQLMKSMGGAGPIVGRAVLNPHPDDAALTRHFRSASGYATALNHFSHYLRQNDKLGIAGRIYDKSLDKDVESYKAASSNGGAPIESALVYLRKNPPRVILGNHLENAVSMEARPRGDAAQHTAPQQGFDWPEELLPVGYKEGTDLPLSLAPTAHQHQAPDFGEAVPHLNWRHGDQGAPEELVAARDRSSPLPSEAVPHKSGRGLATQPRLWAEKSASPELFRRRAEQALPASARGVETSSAVDEAAQAARQALAWLQQEMEGIEPMQDPHKVATPECEAQLVRQRDEHESTPAPHPGGGGSMPSTVQPDRPIVVPDGADKRPVYSNDATAIEGLRAAFHAGKAKANTVTYNVNSLFGFSRWLLQNNKPGFAARLYHSSLDQDLKEYESTGGSSTVAGALRYLKKSTGGAQIMARPVVIPYPDDAELIRNYRAASTKEYLAAPATGRNPDTVGGYTNFLRHFSQYLRQNNKLGIAARIHDKSLDKDVESFKAVSYGNRLSISSALAHLRDILPRIVLGRETVLSAHPADAVTRRVGAAAEAGPAAPARAPQPASPATARLPGTYRGLPLVDVTTLTTSSSGAQIGALDPTAPSNVATGRVLGAAEWLSDAHIQRDYNLLEGQLQGINPALAARTRLVDPSVSHLLRHTSPQDARGILQSIYNQNNATADFLFLPVNNGTATSPGTHWSLLLVDRRDPERRFAYHYDSLQREGYNDVPAKQLAGLLNATLAPAPMARQTNHYDCGVFVLEGTWALVERLVKGQRPDHEPLPLDNLVADRQALQDRLRRRLPHEEEPRQLLEDEPASPPMMAFEPGELRQLLEDEPASPPMMAFQPGELRQLLEDEPASPPMMAFEPGELRQLLEDEPASPPMMAFEPGELRQLLEDEPASTWAQINSTPHARADGVHQPAQAPWLPERRR